MVQSVSPIGDLVGQTELGIIHPSVQEEGWSQRGGRLASPKKLFDYSPVASAKAMVYTSFGAAPSIWWDLVLVIWEGEQKGIQARNPKTWPPTENELMNENVIFKQNMQQQKQIFFK
jgi:hypothetical protein